MYLYIVIVLYFLTCHSRLAKLLTRETRVRLDRR